jgi:hypothetical protein
MHEEVLLILDLPKPRILLQVQKTANRLRTQRLLAVDLLVLHRVEFQLEATVAVLAADSVLAPLLESASFVVLPTFAGHF